MGANNELFLRITEEEYFLIPEEIRQKHLSSKITSEEKGDWNENMKDETFNMFYQESKRFKKLLSEREFQLREQRRNNLKQK